MKCSYHPAVEFQEGCNICNKPLCSDCTCKIKGRVYCQDCLAQSAEWLATVKRLRLPADAPQRAVWCSIIPGMGAVYNNEYLKAVAYFAVFASLIMMGNSVHGIFGFGAFTFLVFTMFDSYRTAEQQMRTLMESSGALKEAPNQDKSLMAWGIFLMILGVLFLIQNLIPYYFLNQLWPLVFILLGGYLVYHAMQDQKKSASNQNNSNTGEGH
jgi:predicted membrane protein